LARACLPGPTPIEDAHAPNLTNPALIHENKYVLSGEHEVSISQQSSFDAISRAVNRGPVMGFKICEKNSIGLRAQKKMAPAQQFILGKAQPRLPAVPANYQLGTDRHVARKLTGLSPEQNSCGGERSSICKQIGYKLQPGGELIGRNGETGQGFASFSHFAFSR
jgi:hypothetical protein